MLIYIFLHFLGMFRQSRPINLAHITSIIRTDNNELTTIPEGKTNSSLAGSKFPRYSSIVYEGVKSGSSRWIFLLRKDALPLYQVGTKHSTILLVFLLKICFCDFYPEPIYKVKMSLSWCGPEVFLESAMPGVKCFMSTPRRCKPTWAKNAGYSHPIFDSQYHSNWMQELHPSLRSSSELLRVCWGCIEEHENTSALCCSPRDTSYNWGKTSKQSMEY